MRRTALFMKHDFDYLISRTFDEYYKEDFNRNSVNIVHYCKIIESLPEWKYY